MNARDAHARDAMAGCLLEAFDSTQAPRRRSCSRSGTAREAPELAARDRDVRGPRRRSRDRERVRELGVLRAVAAPGGAGRRGRCRTGGRRRRRGGERRDVRRRRGRGARAHASGADGGCNQADIEANDTPATSRPLAATTDCDDKGNKIRGTLASATDVDWFSFHGSDTPTCVVNPTATVSEPGLRLCVYVKCDSGQGSVPTCAQGTKAPSPPSGLDGCCANTPGSVEASVSCPGTDESTTVMMRVAAASPAPLTCKPATHHLPLLGSVPNPPALREGDSGTGTGHVRDETRAMIRHQTSRRLTLVPRQTSHGLTRLAMTRARAILSPRARARARARSGSALTPHRRFGTCLPIEGGTRSLVDGAQPSVRSQDTTVARPSSSLMRGVQPSSVARG